MSYQSGCHGRVVIGELPEDVRSRLTRLPGEWLEYDPETGAIDIELVYHPDELRPVSAETWKPRRARSADSDLRSKGDAP